MLTLVVRLLGVCCYASAIFLITIFYFDSFDVLVYM